MRKVSDEELAPWLKYFKIMVRRNFSQFPQGHEDLVQEGLKIALSRKLMHESPSRRQITYLLVDAWRSIHKGQAATGMFEVASDEMWRIADPPNQLRDMEIKDKMLSPDEQVFQNRLDGAKEGLNIALEIECRHHLGCTPLIPSDLWDLLS